MSEPIEIDVRYEPDHEVPTLNGTRPMLTWNTHPVHGHGWLLSYLDDPNSPTAGVEEYFIGGDFADVDDAVRSARRWLSLEWGEVGLTPAGSSGEVALSPEWRLLKESARAVASPSHQACTTSTAGGKGRRGAW